MSECRISWCKKKPLANGLCKKHYRRHRRTGKAVQLNHPDVEGVLDSGLKVLDFAYALVAKAHKANGHKLAIEDCESGSCKELHDLALLFASKEEVSHGSTNPHPESTELAESSG